MVKPAHQQIDDGTHAQALVGTLHARLRSLPEVNAVDEGYFNYSVRRAALSKAVSVFAVLYTGPSGTSVHTDPLG